jgi:hypothetical protein
MLKYALNTNPVFAVNSSVTRVVLIRTSYTVLVNLEVRRDKPSSNAYNRRTLLRITNFSHKSCRQKIKTCASYSTTFFFSENRPVYEIM